MASPVDTTVKHYRSDMPGAPVLNGVVGSKIAQLDACLVTGYGLKSATSLVVSGGIATLNFSGGASSAWPEAVILVAGANNTALNGEQKVLTATASAVTFPTTQPNSTDAGTVTFKIAPAGWEKVYSKTNVAAYRSLNLESTRMFLRVDDTNAQFVRVRGYEAMSDIDTGTGLFPTDVMITGGGYWAKSDTTNTTAVAWILASDGRFLIDSVAPGSHREMTYQNCFMRGFGDFIPKNPAGDAYLCGLSHSRQGTTSTMYDGALDGGSSLQIALARSYTGVGGASAGIRRPYTGSASASSGNDGLLGDFPSSVDGSLVISRQFVSDGASPRGDMPGVRYCPQAKAWKAFRMFDTLAHSGRKYLISASASFESSTSSSTNISTDTITGASFIDITGPWR